MKIKYYLTFKLIEIFPRIFINLINALHRQKLNHALKYLKKNKIKIDTVYDIGAYKGHWSTFLNKTSLKKSKFYLFEANSENEKFLKNLNFKYFISILSDKEKKVKFYSKILGGDSYYLENTNFYDKNLDIKEVNTTTLDQIVKKNDIPFPDFIKIDTQGSEIDILKGGNTILKNCSIIYLECPIMEYNLGAPSFSEYTSYMKKIGYSPYEICEIHHVDKALVQIDILFLKTSILEMINPNKKILNIFK